MSGIYRDFDSFVGAHQLSGVWGGVDGECWFILDDVIYRAVEDPDDGYRSYLSSVEAVDFPKPHNSFPSVDVVGIMEQSGEPIIKFYSVTTGRIGFELGTNYSDDYYPYCVMRFYPINLGFKEVYV